MAQKAFTIFIAIYSIAVDVSKREDIFIIEWIDLDDITVVITSNAMSIELRPYKFCR